jgi:hypothetical protein
VFSRVSVFGNPLCMVTIHEVIKESDSNEVHDTFERVGERH